MKKTPMLSMKMLRIFLVFVMSLTSLLTIATPVSASMVEYSFCGRGEVGEAVVSLPDHEALFVMVVGNIRRSNFGAFDFLMIMIDLDQDPATEWDQLPWVCVTDNTRFARMMEAEYELSMMGDIPPPTIFRVRRTKLEVWSCFDTKRIIAVLRMPLRVPIPNEGTTDGYVVIHPLTLRLRGRGCGTWMEDEYEFIGDTEYYEYYMRYKEFRAAGCILARTNLGTCRWPVDSASVSFRFTMEYRFGFEVDNWT